jgi:hypothetical protein
MSIIILAAKCQQHRSVYNASSVVVRALDRGFLSLYDRKLPFMSMASDQSSEVDRFIENQIDTVPHLETLLLAWRARPKAWSPAELASAIYVPVDLAPQILKDLEEKGLLTASQTSEPEYSYRSGSPAQDDLVNAVENAYKRELIRITRMIHSKAPSSIREFARSFRFTKEER